LIRTAQPENAAFGGIVPSRRKTRFHFYSGDSYFIGKRIPEYNDLLQLTNALYHTNLGHMLCLYPMGCITVKTIQLYIFNHTLH
jgi:hypothetical protein